MQLTTSQQRVLVTLQQASEPFSAYALLDRLRGRGFSAPMQVYRALERLAKDGLVHRLATLNAYVPCDHPAGCEHGVRPSPFATNLGMCMNSPTTT